MMSRTSRSAFYVFRACVLRRVVSATAMLMDRRHAILVGEHTKREGSLSWLLLDDDVRICCFWCRPPPPSCC